MKYIIFKRKEISLPVIFHEHINHSAVSLGPEWTPVSAGFCYLKEGWIDVDKKHKSSSLNLKPAQEDETILRLFQEEYPISFFLNFD